MPSHIEFPYCTVGEFAALMAILEKRGDKARRTLLEDAIEAFKAAFESEIEDLDFHLDR